MARKPTAPGAGRPKTPVWTVPVALAIPTAAVLLWLFWGPLTSALAPSLVPALGGVLPRPEGAPRTAAASWTGEDGIAWTACTDAPGGAVRAGWVGRTGLDRVVLAPGGRCSEAAWRGRTLTVRERGQPLLTLAAGSIPTERAAQTALCQAARDEARGALDDLARAAARDEALGVGGRATLNRYLREAPALRYARASAVDDGRLTCFLRSDPPTKPGETPRGTINATMSR